MSTRLACCWAVQLAPRWVRCFSVVVPEKTAKPFMALNDAGRLADLLTGVNQTIRQSLVVPFAMIVIEDAADGVRDVVAQIGEGPLDAIVAPGQILAGHAEDELDDLW